MRTGRSPVPRIHDEKYGFNPGKLDILINRSSEIVVFATGITVHRALNVANKLLEKEIEIDVINVHTFKPVNPDDFYPVLKGKRFVFTVEDHNVIGGLGSLISEMMVENGISAKLTKLGIKDRFGKSGEPQELADLLGETVIEKAIREVVL